MTIDQAPTAEQSVAQSTPNPFSKATRKQSKLRLALEGPAGYGKTYSALAIGTSLLEPGQRLAFIDTEAGSSNKYSGGKPFDFDSIDMNAPYDPRRFVRHIESAEQNGYGVLVLDSLSHAWTGEGGTLDIVDNLAKIKYRGDSHRAWKEGTEIQQELVDAILRSRLHIIACMRTKTDYVREERDDGNGKTRTVIRKAGMKTVQRDELDYEFDIIGRFDTMAVLTVIKSRYATLPPETVIDRPGLDFALALREWLSEGVVVPPPPVRGPLSDAQRTAIGEAIAALGERKAGAKVSLAAHLSTLGFPTWDEFVAHGSLDYEAVLAAIQQYGETIAPPVTVPVGP